MKEELRTKHYIRYTDDAVVVHQDKSVLEDVLPIIACWLRLYRKLDLHPFKVEIRKLNQGIDFLGYVTRPHYRVLRTRTKHRMLAQVDPTNVSSYLGLLKHASAFELSRHVRDLAKRRRFT